jgi:hypothetical protein
VNWVQNLVHLAIGVAGSSASRTMGNARRFARGLTIGYAGLALMGLVPAFKTTFGLIPGMQPDVRAEQRTAAVAAYFGFGQRREAMEIGKRYRRAA